MMKGLWFDRLTTGRVAVSVGALVLVAVALFWRGTTADESLTATVRKGNLSVRLTATGVLKPAQSLTYRSPLAGRETEITFLVTEGTRVNEGDLLVRLDTTELQRELERSRQELRQAQVDLQVAEIDRQEGQAAIESLTAGEGALGVEEARRRLQLAEKKAAGLREEQQTLQPLLDKGFITREELRKTNDALEQAEEDLALARRRADILIEQTHPRDKQRADLQLAQKDAQLENARTRLQEAQARVKLLQAQLEDCSLYARRPGMVVHEEFLGANPRRKIRAGDRVTGSLGLVTIPEVNSMLVEASVSEADVHRVQPGQQATVALEAFPDLRLSGKVARVGTLASASADRPFEEKRFDLVVQLDRSGADLRPEMTARVDVVLGERTNVLLLPINAVFNRQGQFVAHLVGPFGAETRSVELGQSSDAFVEVVSGLKEGDRVSLTEPANASTSPTPTAPAPGGRNGASSGQSPLGFR